ncbi:BLUF domain-containing protein [Sphingomonas profundi]|uniref:BLUF domain-containing protein n=1 Tax=Alterirhizorhabdus profundi TaxID=2681549 RepID=UPI0012E79BE0|nr:BLUF domain-containing protein [Sphingomonas profundi]
MLRICYTSEARSPDDQQQFAEIVSISAALNKRDGVTGLLLWDGLLFLQALEGPDEAVSECYARIARDVRHFQIRVIFNTEIDHREFGHWSMTQRTLGRENTREFEQEVKALVNNVSDFDLRAFFVGFAALSDGRRRLAGGRESDPRRGLLI